MGQIMGQATRTIALMLFLLPARAHADSLGCDGDVIQYTTFVSTIIPAEVAAAQGIIRSKDHLITNITVLKQGRAVDAKVVGTATNLLDQPSELLFKPIREEGSVYYLATQVASERDTIRYAISVTPAGAQQACKLDFIRNYYEAGSR